MCVIQVYLNVACSTQKLQFLDGGAMELGLGRYIELAGLYIKAAVRQFQLFKTFKNYIPP
jgi:hypothetical protein